MMPDPHAIPVLAQVFYFLRHGETTSNRDKTIAGWLDVDLTDLGRAQARAAIDRLAPVGVTAIYSSGLRRARDTAAIIADALRLGVTPIAEINERNWGELEGKPQVLRVHGATTPGAETREQHTARTAAGLAKVPAQGVPLIVAHSGTYRVLCRLLGHEEGQDPVANCHPVRITPAGASWRVELL
jgi:probable phosphoglycerate mutase